jgi:uncharacterized protein YdhG (YjbR/CyaY superfamily)
MGKKVSRKPAGASGVDKYIANAPKELQGKLREIRAAIREAAPGATERTDYFQLPGYSYEGYDYDGMFVWFSFKKPNIRLHLRPPVIQNYKRQLASGVTTKAIVGFPADRTKPGNPGTDGTFSGTLVSDGTHSRKAESSREHSVCPRFPVFGIRFLAGTAEKISFSKCLLQMWDHVGGELTTEILASG